jgi:hypothetical protein
LGVAVVHSSSSKTSSRRGGSDIGGSGAFPHRFGSGGIGEDPDGSVFDGGPIGGVYEKDFGEVYDEGFFDGRSVGGDFDGGLSGKGCDGTGKANSMDNLIYPAGGKGSQLVESPLHVPWNLQDQFDDGGSLVLQANEASLAQMVQQSPAAPAIPTFGLDPDPLEFRDKDAVRLSSDSSCFPVSSQTTNDAEDNHSMLVCEDDICLDVPTSGAQESTCFDREIQFEKIHGNNQ